MSAIKLSAQKVKDVSNLKKIAEAWREAVINRSWVIDGKEPEGGDIGIPRISVFAEQLAGRSKTSVSDMVLNDANVYVSSGDKYASKLRYETITCFNGWKITYVDVFINTLNFMSSSPNRIVSYCVVCNLPANVPLETTPFGFTRGLREDGKWDEKAGLYGSKGGYVIY
ncbi:MAG: hypothetical protein LBB05_00305, partial [Puniceicoccales bacterium]|nr:hypothetical protein [Puniceicoccales bacterium]